MNTSETFPSISVVLPVYNGGSYLMLSIESVLKQIFQNFELLILDDCSTDNSWKYINNINDARITVYKNEVNKGLFYNLNFLINKCNSNLVKLWAQDDIMLPGCLLETVVFHEQYSGVGFSFSGRQMIDEEGTITENRIVDEAPRLVSSNEHARVAFFTGSIAGNIANVCLSKKALQKTGLFNEELKISGDFEMLVRLAKDHPVGYIPHNLVQQREHLKQLSRDSCYYLNHVSEDLGVYRILISYSPPDIVKEGKMIMRKHKLVFYYTLMAKSFLKGNFKQAHAFYKELSAFDNFFRLSMAFIFSKIKKPGKPFYI